MARLTERKRQILNVLSKEPLSGFSLSNELRVRCNWEVGDRPETKRRSVQRKSFNRTILENFDELTVRHMSSPREFDTKLTAGIFARWIVWELIEQALLSALPSQDELTIVVGRDEGTALVNLNNGHHAVVGTSILLTDLVLVANHEIDDGDLLSLSAVPWHIRGIVGSDIRQIRNTEPIANLGRLPYGFVTLEGIELSTSRKRFKYR